jgi:hypothetical protein
VPKELSDPPVYAVDSYTQVAPVVCKVSKYTFSFLTATDLTPFAKSTRYESLGWLVQAGLGSVGHRRPVTGPNPGGSSILRLGTRRRRRLPPATPKAHPHHQRGGTPLTTIMIAGHSSPTADQRPEVGPELVAIKWPHPHAMTTWTMVAILGSRRRGS